MDSSVDPAFVAKAEQRQRNARMPFENKIRVLVRLQQLAAPILAQRGKHIYVWQLNSEGN